MRFSIPPVSHGYSSDRRRPKRAEAPPALSDREKLCSAAGCARIIHAEQFMCIRHWNLVPAELQSQVFKSDEGKKAAALHVAQLEGLR